MNTNFKNDLAPAVIELNRMNEELQADNERLLKIVRHQKYKRCLAMALLVLEKRETYPVEYEEWCLKWYKRWLELADKFREQK